MQFPVWSQKWTGQQKSNESPELSEGMEKLCLSVWAESGKGLCIRGVKEGRWLDVRKGVAGWQVRKVIPQRRGI